MHILYIYTFLGVVFCLKCDLYNRKLILVNNGRLYLNIKDHLSMKRE